MTDELWRYERKFRVEGLAAAEVRALVRLHPAVFSEIYEPRWVDNLYLDTPGRSEVQRTVDGLSRRAKFRIRWYGPLFGRIERPALEIKRKEGQRGSKSAFPLPPFELGPGFSAERLAAWLAKASLPDEVRAALAPLEPVLLNRYRRAYYLSGDRAFRLTLDSELEFYELRQLDNAFLHRRSDPDLILELKYGGDEDDEADRITAAFPFRLTKSSKYANGVERLLD